MPATNFTPIQLYRSTTASQVPTSGNLSDGELAINTNDEKLYFKNSGGTVKLLASSAGASGDVVGPASATDNAVVRFDGTTGKLVQNSVVTIADSTGDVAGVGALTMGGNLTLNGGTANGVLYLNGSKVATSGSALTFDGTTFVSANTQTGLHSMRVYNGSNASAGDGAGIQFGVNGSNIYGRLWTDNNSAAMYFDNLLSTPFIWRISGTSEQMRLTSTGLGIGTSSPQSPLHVYGTNGITIGVANDTWQTAAIRAIDEGGTYKGTLAFYTHPSSGSPGSPTERLRIDSSGNLGLGGSAARATTAGSAIFNIFNGTAPVGTLTNGISLYSSSGEAYVMDAAGNATLFSPHDRDTNEWIFRSKHTPSGKVLKIDVERLLRFVNDHFGLDAVQEFIEP